LSTSVVPLGVAETGGTKLVLRLNDDDDDDALLCGGGGGGGFSLPVTGVLGGRVLDVPVVENLSRAEPYDLMPAVFA